jgi:hypothetical protein
MGLALPTVPANGGKTPEARVADAERDLAAAEAKLAETPSVASVDEPRRWEGRARVLRRAGQATVQVAVVDARTGAAQAQATAKIPFEASDAEIPADAAAGFPGHAAHAPTQEEAMAALADAVVAQVERALVRLSAQRSAGADLGDYAPGSRSRAAVLARHAASDRPVRLVLDALDRRPDARLAFPVQLPDDAKRRCFTFVATPLDGRTDVGLSLAQQGSPVARDVRPAEDASFEVCALAGGAYELVASAVAPTGSPSAGVLVSVFESTPGAVGADDLTKSVKGTPALSAGLGAVLDVPPSAARVAAPAR